MAKQDRPQHQRFVTGGAAALQIQKYHTTIHGGEYTNIIADHVVLNGNIRAVHEETYMARYFPP